MTRMSIKDKVSEMLKSGVSTKGILMYLYDLRDNLSGATMSNEHNPLAEIEEILDRISTGKV